MACTILFPLWSRSLASLPASLASCNCQITCNSPARDYGIDTTTRSIDMVQTTQNCHTLRDLRSYVETLIRASGQGWRWRTVFFFNFLHRLPIMSLLMTLTKIALTALPGLSVRTNRVFISGWPPQDQSCAYNAHTIRY